MKKQVYLVLVFPLVLLAGAALWATITQAAQGINTGAPTVVSYQGEVRISGVPYDGNGYFKFAVVNASGDSTYWSNDGTSSGGSIPTAPIGLTVSDGLFNVLLGDTTLAGMTQPLTPAVFSQTETYLRVWFCTAADGRYNLLSPDTRIAAVPYALQAQEAADADTVDGLHASEIGANYQNVVVVAKSGGDYTSVQAAINGITDAGSGNPYLVWVAPGVYVEQVTMKPYVHLQGAGQDATVLASFVSNNDYPLNEASLKLASDTSLRDLTVENKSTGYANVALLATTGMTRTLVADVSVHTYGSGLDNYAIVLQGNGTGIRLQQVSAIAESGSDQNCGLKNDDDSMATLRGGSFVAIGGQGGALGIYNTNGGIMLADSISALGEKANSNYGLVNRNNAVVKLNGGSFTGRRGDEAIGIRNGGINSILEAEAITALGENGSWLNQGLFNDNDSTTTLRGGSFNGRGGESTDGIQNQGVLVTYNVTALGENGIDSNYGLQNGDGGQATLYGGSFIGYGGINTFGVYNTHSSYLKTESITALGENGNGENHGLYNAFGSDATLRGGSFTGRGGDIAYGIGIYSGVSTLVAESVTALGDGGSSYSYGLYGASYAGEDSYITVTLSVLDGASYPFSTEFIGGSVSNSRLVGPYRPGEVPCVLVTRGKTISTDGSTCP